jgi:hypothetical protein
MLFPWMERRFILQFSQRRHIHPGHAKGSKLLSLPHATNGLVRPNDTIVSTHRLRNAQAERGDALLDNVPAILALAGPMRPHSRRIRAALLYFHPYAGLVCF